MWPLLLVIGACAGAVGAARRFRTSRRIARAADAARRQAEAMVDANEEFIARVCHDLRGPLNAMAASVWQLEHHGDHPEVRARSTAAIRRAATVQRRLVSDLLDHSRASHGKLSLELGHIPISEPVRWAVEQAADEAAQKQLSLHVLARDGDAPVIGDSVRLQQVFVNLVQNAIKFTPVGGAVLVTFTRSPQHVHVSIIDTGVGIAPDLLGHIFEPFRQTNERRDTRRGGLGLGLSIARQLVHLHHGEITVSSAGVGAGTTFTVQLPLATNPESAEQPAWRAAVDPPHVRHGVHSPV